MVKIRLARGGVRNYPFYRVVVSDTRSFRDGRFIEKVGFFDPIAINNLHRINTMFLNLDRITYWVKHGAILSNRVLSLIKYYNKNYIHRIVNKN